jgi:hypothetical protein
VPGEVRIDIGSNSVGALALPLGFEQAGQTLRFSVLVVIGFASGITNERMADGAHTNLSGVEAKPVTLI